MKAQAGETTTGILAGENEQGDGPRYRVYSTLLKKLRGAQAHNEKYWPGDGYCLEDGHTKYLFDISDDEMDMIVDALSGWSGPRAV